LATPTAPQSVAAVTEAAAKATDAVIAKVQAGDFDLDEARDALTEKEFNAYVASLDGGDDINSDTLRAIAHKLTKNMYKDAAKSKAETQALSKSLKRLEDEITRLNKERDEERAAASKAAESNSNDVVYTRLSEHCAKAGVDLEAALGDAKTMETLRNESRSDDSPFTFLQEITAYNAKGKFADAARVVGEAVKRAGGEVKPVVVSPSESEASVVKHVEKTYEDELAAIHKSFSHSSKTFDDLSSRQQSLDALRKKHGR
jgi:polyhydroxyalkanoate synthesis regulator phasin